MGGDTSPGELREPRREEPNTPMSINSARPQRSSGQVLSGAGKGFGRMRSMTRRKDADSLASSPGLFERTDGVLKMGVRWRSRASRDAVDELLGAVDDGDVGICRPFSVEVIYVEIMFIE